MKLRGKLIKKMLQIVGGAGGITFSVLSCIFMFKNILFLSNNLGMIQIPMVLKYLSFAMAGLVGVEIGAFIGLPLLQDLFYEEHKIITSKNNRNISNNKTKTLEEKSLKKEHTNTDKKEKIDSLEALKQELLNCKIDEEEQDNKQETKLVRIKK